MRVPGFGFKFRLVIVGALKKEYERCRWDHVFG
jgi:hypothetical protein